MRTQTEFLTMIMGSYLQGAEESECVAEMAEWSPRVLACYDESGQIDEDDLDALWDMATGECAVDDEDTWYDEMLAKHPSLAAVLVAMGACPEF